MKKKISLLLFSTFIASSLLAQSINYATRDNLAKKTSSKTAEKMKSQETSDIQLIVVLPIRDNNGNITKESKDLAESIAHQLNLTLSDKRLRFQVKSYTDDVLLSKELEKTNFSVSNQTDYYKDIIGKFKPDYILTGFYAIDETTNSAILENMKLYNNYLDKENNKLTIISIENVSTEKVTNTYIPRSSINL